MKHSGLSMTEEIKAVVTGYTRADTDRTAARLQPSLTQGVKSVANRKRNPPATRTGRKGIVIYVDQETAAAIRRLASDFDTTVQALGEKAFKYLFEKLGEPSPA